MKKQSHKVGEKNKEWQYHFYVVYKEICLKNGKFKLTCIVYSQLLLQKEYKHIWLKIKKR